MYWLKRLFPTLFICGLTSAVSLTACPTWAQEQLAFNWWGKPAPANGPETVRQGTPQGKSQASSQQTTRKSSPNTISTRKPASASSKLPVAQQSPSSEQVAIDAYNKGVELFQIAQGQAERGNVNGQKALLQESAKQFRQALLHNPNLVEAQSNLGFVELTLRRYKPAVRAFQAALRIQPNHANTLNGLATSYTLLDEPQAALDTLNQLLKVSPGNEQYWFNHGCALHKMHRYDEARKSYRQALSINPADQRSLFNLAALAEAEGKTTEAISLFTQAKNNGIDTPIGLEAYRRIQFLQAAASPSSQVKPPSTNAPQVNPREQRAKKGKLLRL